MNPRPKYVLFSLILVSVIIFGGCLKKPISQTNSNSDIQVNTNVQAGEVAVLSDNIIVNQPISNAGIVSPLTVNGRARTSSGVVAVRLLDAFELELATTTVAVSANSVESNFFSAELNFPVPKSPAGWLEVFEPSPDNTVQPGVIRLPVNFSDYKNPQVKVFFSNIKQDPNIEDCAKVYPVTREINFNEQLAAGAIRQLLAGLTESEMKDGFVSNLPEGVKVQRLELVDGVMHVDFNQTLQAGVGGSCRVIAIRSQIEETLKQFEGVAEVEISIDGKTEEILQP